MHWGDFSTLDELVSAIARQSETARLLIIETYRSDVLANDHPLRTMKQELELHRYCEELRLKLLSEEDVTGYPAKRFSTNGSRRFDSLAPVIHERTDGNPLFMVNVVDYLVDAGLLMSSSEASAAESAEILRTDRLGAPRSIRLMISQLMWAKLDEAEFLAREGQIADSLALIADATRKSSLRSARQALRQRADLLAQSNADASTIDAAYRAAIDCARSQGARYYELQATTLFARWLKSRARC